MSDLPAIAYIHITAFPESALSALGCGVVRRYYEWLMLGPHDVVALGTFRKTELVGFCIGGVFREAMLGFLRRNRAFLVWRVFTHPWVVNKPIFRKRLGQVVCLLRYKARSRIPVPPQDRETVKTYSFGILSIAVRPSHQGLGIGQSLIRETESIATHRGFQAMHLTVHPTNQQAIRFYEGLGWKKISGEGSWAGRMTKILSTTLDS